MGAMKEIAIDRMNADREKEAAEHAAKTMRTLKQPPFKRKSPKPGRNQICPCGSGKKFKNCHEIEYRIKLQKHVMESGQKNKR